MSKRIYKTLGFALFRKCNASCKMCCFESSPSSIEHLDVDRIKEYIIESKSIEEIESIALTGGEPFLEYDLVKELVELASSCGKSPTCITNAHWATSYDKAYTMLKELKKLGLKRINYSHDAYHKEFVKTEYMKNALTATRDLQLQTSLGISRIKNEKIGEIINELGNSVYNVNLQVFPVISCGGAAKAFKDEEFDKPYGTQSETMRCIYNGNLVVGYDGNILPCCSQKVVDTCLSIGNFQNMSLTEAMKKLKNNSILYFLRNKNLSFFTDIAQKELGLEIPRYVSSPCELCAILFKEENMDALYPYIQQAIYALKKGA